MPGEYAAIGRPGGPQPWKMTDVVATASLAGGIFGKGGGDELTQMELRRSFVARYGSRRGVRLWREWAAYEDADAPTTVRGTRFPYQTPPKRPARGGLALADAGSLRRTPVVLSDGPAARGPLGGLLPPGLRTMAMSNALARVGGGVRERPAARRLRTADRLLRAADPDGAGRPCAGDRRSRRRLPRGQPLRPARPRPGLRLERHLGGPGHHRHVRRRALRARRGAADDRFDALPLPRARACRSSCSTASTAGRRRWRTQPGRARSGCVPSARSSGSSPAARRSRARR